MTNEIWKPIKGLECYYEISNLGRIKALNRLIKRNSSGNFITKEKILKLSKNPNGYVTVTLYKDGSLFRRLVHRLVAEAFILKPDNKNEIDHIDTNRSNNEAENLRWCTRSENNRNPITNKKMSESHLGIKRSKESIEKWRKARIAHGNRLCRSLNYGKSKPVEQIDPASKMVIATFPSMQEVKRKLGFGPPNICRCCKGYRDVAYGFIWRYKS